MKIPKGWPTEEMLAAGFEVIRASAPNEREFRIVLFQTMLAAAPEQHPDDEAVDRFAAAMKEKLAKARVKGRGGWDDPERCSVEHLQQLLHSHTAKGDPVDVGNFAMMLHQRGGNTTQPAQGDEPVYQLSRDGVNWNDISKVNFDRRSVDTTVYTRTLYTRPQSDKLREAASATLKYLEECMERIEWEDGAHSESYLSVGEIAYNLQMTLEGE